MIAQIVFLALAATAFAGSENADQLNTGLVSDSRCPANRFHLLLPHEYDCTKYYRCRFGYRTVDSTDCNPGTEFSFDLQVCVHRLLANCQLPGVPEIVTPKPTTSAPVPETEAPVPETDAPNIEDSGWVLDSRCPAIRFKLLLPHEYDCTKYYRCRFGRRRVNYFECNPGTEFSSRLQACVRPFLANCKLPGVPEAEIEISTPEPVVTDKPAEIITPTPEPVVTDKPAEIITPTPEPVVTEKPAEIVTSKSTTSAPVHETDAPNTEAPGNEVTAPEGTVWLENGCPANWDLHWLLPHENDCVKFYYCVLGKKVVRKCSNNTVFNPSLQVCDHPSNVDCTGSN